MSALISTPSVETHLETQAVLYPSLRYLVQLLPLDHRRVIKHVRNEVEQNPFLRSTTSSGNKETLVSDVLPDWYTPPAAELSLQEHLQGQISALNLSSRQQKALLYLIEWLSPSGYLEESPQVWAAGSGFSISELEGVIPDLQGLDPLGIGARSLQECLLLQLPNQPENLATLLVRDYLEEIAACVSNSTEAQCHRDALLQKLRQTRSSLDSETLKSAIRQIQTLEPRPARNFSHSPAPIVTPDLKAEPHAGGWQVMLAYEVSRDFYLDEEAVAVLNRPHRKTKETQRLEVLLQKARSLLTALNQWQDNLLKVGEFLVARQQAFLSSRDALDLVPTPQQMVAQAVGLSNATISRIVRERYLLIGGQPSQIVPLQKLCTPARVGGHTPQQIQQFIQQLIQEESPAKPYSDDQLAQWIKLRFGLPIARRTVTKYRKMAGVDSSSRRKMPVGQGIRV
ncbi:RNA polymerase subunit sigma-54 [Brasilonema octagenarum UFV-E1]|uniref:RNA polymerase subunit sigma-54 n=1 Tax=Brasilonema sennae CENA114 TaxID=415709 RepID=A0A856MJQ3_9CYAN|nr:RNA polymerase subunit sigma-54 [Brasilonema sennae]QDL09176.1 RNA polymerase subunit sigma-54 [Brasilonema sennae CENA114]QDL15533.1 RNA polymerase subunit sigma-54 [Brasilonema octagenarum UFV-E1]